MRSRRFRTWAKWVCTLVAVLLMAAWAVSGWYGLSWISGNGTTQVGVICGRFILHRYKKHRPESTWFLWDIATAGSGPRWLLRFAASKEAVVIPLWVPLVRTSVCGGLLWRDDIRTQRRRRDGLCPSCGYDRRGPAAGAPCPECGAV